MKDEFRLESFGIQLYHQLHSLRRICEEQQFAKAVKADDTYIPIYLWNEQVRITGYTAARQDIVLTKLQRIGHRLFLRGIRTDCSMFMADQYGYGWTSMPRQGNKGRLTQMGRDNHAICSTFWRAAHTNWFEYQSGSRLVHFRFPI